MGFTEQLKLKMKLVLDNYFVVYSKSCVLAVDSVKLL